MLRRCPGAVIYAAPLTGTDPDEDHARYPVFRGGLNPETAMLGFDRGRFTAHGRTGSGSPT
ncbi:hypothetical protein [Streptomyces sp. PTD5-9]|uniref:hypothetical protein n=1 Tax=Streptomyces sp. PTD5-9 TaxID=3120150 RepID=UPI0030093D22